MKKIFWIICFLFISSYTFSQSPQKGFVTNKTSGKKSAISYLRYLSSQSDSSYNSRYSLYNAKGDTLYKVFVRHNPGKRSIRVSALDVKSNAQINNPNLDYHYYNCGMVFNNISFLDTAVDAAAMYDYALYFQDTSRTYVSLSSLTIQDSLMLSLDKIFKSVISDHNRLIKNLYASPSLAKLLQKQEKLVSKRLNSLEKSNNESSAEIKGLKEKNEKLAIEINNCKNNSAQMIINNDSLSRMVYASKYAPNSYPTTNKESWELKIDSAIYNHCAEYFFENTDIKYVIKITVDTNGVVIATDLSYPASVTSLSTKDNYLYTVLTGMIKKEIFAPNKIDIYGRKFAVKTTLEKDLFVSIKNRKDKIIYTDKDNSVYSETKLALPNDVKNQFNAKLYAGAKAGKYGVKIISFTINKFVKEIIKEVEF
jgi:hypothetical protein